MTISAPGECPPEWDADYWFDGANYLSELTEKEISLWRNGLNSVEDLQANHIDETFTWGAPHQQSGGGFSATARARRRTFPDGDFV